MSDSKIGSDVLGYGGSGGDRISPKKKKELEERVKQEMAKKKRLEEEEKLSKLPIPDNVGHEMTIDERQELLEKALDKDVHVDEHFRSKPQKKKKEV